MVGKVLEEVKEFVKADKPLLRKLRILRYVTCLIILFVAFCDSYWNLLEYIDLPRAPLFQERYRIILHSSEIMVWILWGLYSALYQNLYNVFDRKFWIKLSYVYILIDFVITMYFLIYALNLVVEFVNGLTINIREEAAFAVVYLVYCALQSSYTSHKIRYQKREQMIYTGFCDSKGEPIPKEAKVFYKGKQHKVEKYEGEYRLLPHGVNWIGSDSLKLEDAASDLSGKLLLIPYE